MSQLGSRPRPTPRRGLQAQATEAAKAKKDQEELDRLRAEQVKREQQAHDEAVRRQAAEEARQKLLAEEAEQKKVAEAAAAKAAADEAARQKAMESDRANAAEAEAKLNLGLLDRQHVQVALNSLGFGAVAVDGTFGQSTHDMIAAWQKTRSYPATGYLTGPENQELRRAGAAAIARFDDEQKKAEAAKEKATAAPAPPVAPPQTAAALAASRGRIDRRQLELAPTTATRTMLGGPFTMPVHLVGSGWARRLHHARIDRDVSRQSFACDHDHGQERVRFSARSSPSAARIPAS